MGQVDTPLCVKRGRTGRDHTTVGQAGVPAEVPRFHHRDIGAVKELLVDQSNDLAHASFEPGDRGSTVLENRNAENSRVGH
jgi:hypothetical protein